MQTFEIHIDFDTGSYIITNEKGDIVYQTKEHSLAIQKMKELTFVLEKPLEGTQFSYHKDAIKKAIVRNDGYCPCTCIRNEDTKCPCKHYRETLECHCNLYIKIKEKLA